MHIDIIAVIGAGLNVEDDKLFVNDRAGAEDHYMSLIEGLGWERDEELFEDESEDIQDFLSELEDENIVWLEYEIKEA